MIRKLINKYREWVRLRKDLKTLREGKTLSTSIKVSNVTKSKIDSPELDKEVEENIDRGMKELNRMKGYFIYKYGIGLKFSWSIGWVDDDFVKDILTYNLRCNR